MRLEHRPKIRICHLVESLAVGGMENGLVNLANHFDYSRFDFFICCFAKRGRLSERVQISDARVIEMNYGRGSHLEAVLPLALLFRQKRVHIVHTHGWGARSLLGLMAARLAGVSFCVNGEHGVLHLTKTRQYYLQKLTFTMFDDVLTVSYGLKEKLIRRFELHPDVIRVIPNGVDAERFSGSYPVDSLKRDLGLVANEFVIGVIGTLKKQKNQSLVLEAIRSIKNDGSKIKLLLIGDGPDRSLLALKAESLGVSDRVLFLGHRDDVPELLCLMNALVLPSINDHEGMSNVILEAMASRVPVISTCSVGALDLIQDGENGVLVAHDDPVELAERIKMLMKDSTLRLSLANNALEKVLREHTIDTMVRRYQDYYKSLMDGFLSIRKAY